MQTALYILLKKLYFCMFHFTPVLSFSSAPLVTDSAVSVQAVGASFVTQKHTMGGYIAHISYYSITNWWFFFISNAWLILWYSFKKIMMLLQWTLFINPQLVLLQRREKLHLYYRKRVWQVNNFLLFLISNRDINIFFLIIYDFIVT